MEKNNYCRTLTKEEVELRVGQTSKDKTRARLLLYKNARVDMALLDERFGAENWECDYKELKGNLYCGVGVRYAEGGQLVWKWDCGTESNTEAEKGEASDAFKRACVRHGQGRELYTAPDVWVEVPSEGIYRDTFKITELDYNDRREINVLTIVHKKSGKVVFKMGEAPAEEKKKPIITGADIKEGRYPKVVEFMSKYNPDDFMKYKEGLDMVQRKYDIAPDGLAALSLAVGKIRKEQVNA